MPIVSLNLILARGRDSGVIHELSNSIESLTNLLYRIKLECNNAPQVQWYAEKAEEPLQCLRDIVEREPRKT